MGSSSTEWALRVMSGLPALATELRTLLEVRSLGAGRFPGVPKNISAAVNRSGTKVRAATLECETVARR